MMRVAMITHGYAPRIGGAERQLGALAPVLQSRGLEVSILTRRLPNTSPFEVIDGVPVYRFPIPGPKALAALVFALSALPTIKKLAPDLIHAHELISPATTAWLAHRLYKVPFILTPHSSGPQGDVQRMRRKFLGKARLSRFREEASAFISISSEIDTELEALGIPAHQRLSIGNGVDTRRFIPADPPEKQRIRAQMELPAQSLLAVFVGRLVPVKRLDILIGIWPLVREKYPDAVLLIAGSGPLEYELKAAAVKGVRFLGSQEDILPVLQASDLFLLSSDSEGLPVALLEAMSCGLPGVITGVGGIPDVVTSHQDGVLVPAGSPDAFLQAVFLLLDNPNLRTLIGRNARERIVQSYSVDDMATRLIELYQQIIHPGAKL